MDIFIRNIPPQCTDRQLADSFHQYLKAADILTFNCKKFKGNGCGLLTILDSAAALKFIRLHGTPQNAIRGSQPLFPISLHGRQLICAPSKAMPDPLLLECLAKEDADRRNKTKIFKQREGTNQSLQHHFPVEYLHCGLWDFHHSTLTFYPCYQDLRKGTLVFGRKGALIMLNASSACNENVRIDIPYHSVESIITGNTQQPSVTFSLRQSPSFLKLQAGVFDLAKALPLLSVNGDPFSSASNTRSRVCNLHPDHKSVAGSCMVYRLVLANQKELIQIQKTLSGTHGSPPSVQWPTHMKRTITDFDGDMRQLQAELQVYDSYDSLHYTLKFQLQRLAQNGYLSPKKVIQLIPYLQVMLKDFTLEALVEALRTLYKYMPYASPDIDPSRFAVKSLVRLVKKYAMDFKMVGSTYNIAKRLPHLALIHKVQITPAGTYLEGPELETKNRVLRKYPDHSDYFLRVTFSDEDYQYLRRDPQVSRTDIFQNRFRVVLDSMVSIAGRGFVFLGFSHSSLRAQQCWFMAPFVHQGQLIHAQEVIKELGDFSKIRSPAKCAARIGQTFSDATDTIPIHHSSVKSISDIERYDANHILRVFTDGVGTISTALLRRVWTEFSRTKKRRASLLQIRYQGAKGMLTLDTTLKGEKLCIRPSMRKFPAPNANDLEICGAAYKRLPMYLNRQFVKILEDLGVASEAFLELQQRAVAGLKLMANSPINAANFLERNYVGTAARLPSLIRLLEDIDLNFRQDDFLCSIAEIATLVQLRDIKHRARIPVSNAHTLYGIADETGFLQSGQVHVIIRQPDDRRQELEGKAVITRAPALHPGDVQMVTVVKVPEYSSNKYLDNCVIFSQHGDRDLPSQLSGGDLDGDLYNIIFDKSLFPTRIVEPADYPRPEPIDIRRPVNTTDMTNFFLTFMETDQLGYICNTHMQMADQKQDGTLSDECIVLAGLASTAVDYSKTGIAVDMNLMPRCVSRYKPDFMANAPRLIIDGSLAFEDEDLQGDDEQPDAISALEPDVQRVRYYRSTKVLGILYRAIDETKFLDEMQHQLQHGLSRENQTSGYVIDQVWNYVQGATQHFQWEHHRKLGREIRDNYEAHLIDAMYQFSPSANHPLSELEVFSGNILGKAGALPNKRVREYNMSMKDKFNRDVTYTIDWILHGDPEEAASSGVDGYEDDAAAASNFGASREALERSIACLAVSREEPPRTARKIGVLRSFGYVASAVCLRELQNMLDGFRTTRFAY